MEPANPLGWRLSYPSYPARLARNPLVMTNVAEFFPIEHGDLPSKNYQHGDLHVKKK